MSRCTCVFHGAPAPDCPAHGNTASALEQRISARELVAQAQANIDAETIRQLRQQLLDTTARAVRCEGERDVAQDALERIYGETRDSGDDPGILCFSIYATARDALQALGVL